MAAARVAPYGAWHSPITAELVAAAGTQLDDPRPDGDDLYWLESRPAEGGRVVLVHRSPAGAVTTLTPPGFNLRSRVHEYGGAPYIVERGTIYFVNFADQRLYRQSKGGTPEPLTPANDWRYADFQVDRRRGLLFAVGEQHVAGEVRNAVVRVLLQTGATEVVVSGNDFYAAPRLSPDGNGLAWLTWNHPYMPWDESELWLASLDASGAVADSERLAGGPGESVVQPEWSPAGDLCFVSDRSGWWNLYRRQGSSDQALAPLAAEFGRPHWVFGGSLYAFAGPQTIACSFHQPDGWRLAVLNLSTGSLSPLPSPCTEINVLRVQGDRILLAGGAADTTSALYHISLQGEATLLRCPSPLSLDPAYLSSPRPVTFASADDRTAYAVYYPPHNPDYAAPAGERPPLLVHSHGGPTSAARLRLNLEYQYFTSRGIAVVDVDYGGSTGYGREYRQLLQGQWGIIDVQDCGAAATYLAEQGLADPQRLAIAGGSAGGYTTLCALTFADVFQAGASRFGVGDLEALARDTHKFESRYLDGLIGPYPQRRDLYLARSPIQHTDRLNCAIIFLQGLDDPVVPPNQAEAMVAALRRRGLPVAYLAFAGEGHGFRRAENIQRSLEAELFFFSRIFGFTLADPVTPVAIENL